MSGRDASAALRVDDAGRKRQTAFLEKPRLPGGIERLVESYIEKKTGKPWNDPAVLDRIANAILAQKSRYWKERQVSYRKADHVLGYPVYHAPGLSLSLPRASGARTATCSMGSPMVISSSSTAIMTHTILSSCPRPGSNRSGKCRRGESVVARRYQINGSVI